MQVILREDIDTLGRMGDVVKVADGYGRNYLVPMKKAIEATPKNVHAMDHAKKMVSDRIRKLKKEATVEAARNKESGVSSQNIFFGFLNSDSFFFAISRDKGYNHVHADVFRRSCRCVASETPAAEHRGRADGAR